MNNVKDESYGKRILSKGVRGPGPPVAGVLLVTAVGPRRDRHACSAAEANATRRVGAGHDLDEDWQAQMMLEWMRARRRRQFEGRSPGPGQPGKTRAKQRGRALPGDARGAEWDGLWS